MSRWGIAAAVLAASGAFAAEAPSASASAAYVPAVGAAIFASGTQLWVFWQGSSGGIADAVESLPSGTWSGPSTLPGTVGTVQSAPSATVSMGDGEIDVFWQGRDDGIWRSAYTAGGGWSAQPTELAGTAGAAASAPTAMNWQSGQQDPVFWRGAGGGIDLDNVYVASGTTSGVVGVPTSFPAGSTPVSAPAAAGYTANELTVSWLGSNGAIWATGYDASAGAWESSAVQITPAGAATSAPSAADTAGGNSENIVYRTTDGSIGIIYYATTTGAWSAPQQVGGTAGAGLSSAPVMTSDPPDGGLDLLWESGSGQVVRTSWTPSGSWLVPPRADVPMTAVQPIATPVSTGSGTVNPPRRCGRVHVRVKIAWRWRPAPTIIRSVRIAHLSRRASLRLTCTGRGCPRHRWSARPRGARRLLHRLRGTRLRGRVRLVLTISVRHKVPERVRIVVRPRRRPAMRLVR